MDTEKKATEARDGASLCAAPCSAAETTDQVAEALQHVWDCHLADTGLAPECITIHGHPNASVSANFHRGNFAHWVARYLSQNTKVRDAG